MRIQINRLLLSHTWNYSIEIRLIMFFVVKDGEALYSQQKQDWEWTMAQIMNFLLPNSDLNLIKWGKPLAHSVQMISRATP